MAEVGENEREATTMRAYLQRAEVRLSTMHRIGGSFLSGAGLLLILPVFFKDVLGSLVGVFLGELSMQSSFWDIVMFVVPCLLAFAIPLVALWFLLADLAVFYFSANIPRDVLTEDVAFHPRFALTAIPYADDEAPRIKSYLRALQFGTPLSRFLIPHPKRHSQWLKTMIGTPEGQQVALPHGKWLDGLETKDEYEPLRMAFGLAGAYDRELVYEVAKTELSLIRHNIHLRRLVMRYMKALLLLIWTALLSFVVIAFADKAPSGSKLVPIAFGYFVWASLAPVIVRSPVRWVYREYDQNKPDSTRDPHLVQFELGVVITCSLASIAAAAGVIKMGGGWWVGAGPILAFYPIIKKTWRLFTS